jgi:hypothetical protein
MNLFIEFIVAFGNFDVVGDKAPSSASACAIEADCSVVALALLKLLTRRGTMPGSGSGF